MKTHDDELRGRIWTRRQALTLFGGGALAFKIRATLNGASREFNSQLLFPDAFTTALYASTAPYSTRSTFNVNDGIYNQSGGKTLITPSGSASSGLSASFNVALTV